MSHSRRHSLEPGIDSLNSRFRESVSCQNDVVMNKPDFRELDLDSPVSPLMTRTLTATPATPTTTSTSSSSSSGSVSGRPTANAQPPKSSLKSHSGELSGLHEISASASRVRNPKPGHRRSASAGTTPNFSGSSISPASSHGSHAGSGASSSATWNPSVLPSGNIFPSGRVLKTGMATRASNRPDTLCMGTGNYGHGSVVRGGGKANSIEGNALRASESSDPEEMKRAGNEMYRRGNFLEALALYDRAIARSPENSAYRSNRAAALTALGRLGEAVKECENAVTLDPSYARAHQRLASLYLRLGETENARRHLCFSRQRPDPAEFQRLQTLEKHMRRCADAQKIFDWKSVIRETDAAVASGADSSPLLFVCKAEAYLRLNQIDNANFCISNMPKLDNYPPSTAKLSGMVAEAYVLYVQAQVDMALGRLENAVVKAEKAAAIDQNCSAITTFLNNVKMVARARSRGNELFSSGRYSEACCAYEEGLRYSASSSVLYCNRAACWSKLGLWEKSVEDCDQALRIHPSYCKALLRRADSYGKLGRWNEAVRDYEALRKQLPGDNDVADSLNRAQAALKRTREVHTMGFNNEVEAVLGLDKYKAATSLPGLSVIHFKASSNEQCEEISPFINTLCVRYPFIHFFKVDVEESMAVAKAESIGRVPTFKIYKNGDIVKEIVCPSHQLLEESLKNYIV